MDLVETSIRKTLKNKKVLFLGLEFYDYHSKIKESIVGLGAEVDFFPLVKWNLTNKLFNFGTASKNKYVIRIGQNILKATKNSNYDYVFVLQGWQQSVEFYQSLKEQFSSAKFLMYHWDSLSAHNYLHLVNLFDKVFTYDSKDSKDHPKLNYLPLFFINDYDIKNEENSVFEYDLLFVGRLRSFIERYYYIKKLREFSKKQGLKIYIHLCTDVTYVFKMLLKGVLIRKVNFNILNASTVRHLFDKSKVIIDFHDPKKNGLTMRTFEVLGANKKLYTTNFNIKNESFYDENIIKVINLDNFEIDFNFINSKTCKSDFKKIKDYSLENWIIKLFS
jgi:hypothetical protein